MAELADAHGSGPCGSNTLRVQVPFPAFFITQKYLTPLPFKKRYLTNVPSQSRTGDLPLGEHFGAVKCSQP